MTRESGAVLQWTVHTCRHVTTYTSLATSQVPLATTWRSISLVKILKSLQQQRIDLKACISKQESGTIQTKSMIVSLSSIGGGVKTRTTNITLRSKMEVRGVVSAASKISKRTQALIFSKSFHHLLRIWWIGKLWHKQVKRYMGTTQTKSAITTHSKGHKQTLWSAQSSQVARSRFSLKSKTR